MFLNLFMVGFQDSIFKKIACVETNIKVSFFQILHTKMKTRLHVRKMNLRDLREEGANILVIGPSSTRKNAVIQDILGSYDPITVHTSYSDLWPARKNIRITSSMTKLLEAKGARVIEDIDDPNIFACVSKAPNDDVINIVGIPDCNSHIPQIIAHKLTHIILLGGLTQLRKVWDAFGAVFPKYRDFRQIYLACTDEGDRYSDDFLIIRLDTSAENPNDVLNWGSLKREPAHDITLDIESSFVNLKEHCATEEVVVAPVAKTATIAVAPKLIEEPAEQSPADQSPADSVQNVPEKEEREPRAECIIC